LFIAFSPFILPVSAHSQVDTAWVRFYDGPGHGIDVVRAMAFDSSGNLYVTGESIGAGTDYDFATVKYDPNGNVGWVRRFDGGGNSSDYPSAVAADKAGNIYVAGSGVPAPGAYYDFMTVKYAPNGDSLWTVWYNGVGGGSDDELRGMGIDDSGNVYVAGYSYNSMQVDPHDNFALLKYDGNGNQKLETRGGVPDFYVTSLTIDHAGNSYVTGYGTYLGGRYMVTLKYDRSLQGKWTHWYLGSPGTFNTGHTVVVDDSGNVYATGTVLENGAYHFCVIKYDAGGTQKWAELCDGPGNMSGDAFAVAIDTSGRVFAAGGAWPQGNNEDMFCIAYDPNGDTLWTTQYDGGWGSDAASAIALDQSGSVIVTGYSDGGTNYHKADIVTAAYDRDGKQQWLKRYNCVSNGYDYGNAVGIDRDGSIYVAGQAGSATTGCDFLLMKYVMSGVGVEESRDQAPVQYRLMQNYPNPFNPNSEIGFRLPASGQAGIADGVHVTLKVYDLLGREVATLVNERKAPGTYTVKFDAGEMASGVYFYRLVAGNYIEARKMLLLR